MVKDTKVIERVNLLYPNLMAENAAQKIEELYYSIEAVKDEIAKLRMEAMKKEQSLKEMEKAFRIVSNMVEIEFKKVDIKEIKETCALGIINPSDARNI